MQETSTESKKDESSESLIGESPKENPRLTRTTRKNQQESINVSKEDGNRSRRLTRTKQKNQQINDSKTDEPPRTKQKVQETTDSTTDNNSSIKLPEENRRLTRTSRKNQEEPTEPTKEAIAQDASTNNDSKRTSQNVQEESKVCIFLKSFYLFLL